MRGLCLDEGPEFWMRGLSLDEGLELLAEWPALAAGPGLG